MQMFVLYYGHERIQSLANINNGVEKIIIIINKANQSNLRKRSMYCHHNVVV